MMIANKDLITHAPRIETIQGNPEFTTMGSDATGQVWTSTIEPTTTWQCLSPNRTFDADPWVVGVGGMIAFVLIMCLFTKSDWAKQRGFDEAGELWRTEAAKRGLINYDNINDKMVWAKDKTDIPSHCEVGDDE